MSRGFGRVQRAVIDRLGYAFSESLRELALEIYGHDTPAARSAISRALRWMVSQGYVDHHGPSAVNPDRKLFKLTRRGCKVFQQSRREWGNPSVTPMRDRVFPRNASARQRAMLRLTWVKGYGD